MSAQVNSHKQSMACVGSVFKARGVPLKNLLLGIDCKDASQAATGCTAKWPGESCIIIAASEMEPGWGAVVVPHGPCARAATFCGRE